MVHRKRAATLAEAMIPSLIALSCAVLTTEPPRLQVAVSSGDFHRLVLGDPLPAGVRELAPTVRLAGRQPTGLGPDAWIFLDPERPWITATIAERGDTVGGWMKGDPAAGALSSWRLGRDEVGAFVEPFDPQELPDCAGSVDAPPSLLQGAEGGVAGCDDGSMVDVLMLYTPAAKAAAGGQGSIEAQIAAAIGAANQAYGNSQIAPRIRAVAVAEVTYSEAAFGTDLQRLATPGDGFLDSAHPLRDIAGADLVALVRTSGEYCGIAYLLPGNDPSSAGIGFSVTAWSCLASQTLAHELGHNMGCCHALNDGGGCTTGGLYPYSLGWRFFGQSGTQFRTVMAYQPGARIDNFSNPAINFDGAPTGVPVPQDGGSGVNNALTINETAFAVANFRCTAPLAGTGDCDGNGMVDFLDMAEGRGTDCDGNGLLDQCQLAGMPDCSGPVPGMLCPGGVGQSVKSPSPSEGAYFGRGVAAGAGAAAVGAPGVSVGGVPFVGAAYVFKPAGAGWAHQSTLIPPDPVAYGQFGQACAMDGATLVVGATGAAANGKVYVYAQVGNGYALQQQITCPAATGTDGFGSSIALRDALLVVGARARDAGAVDSGSVFVFRRNANGLFVLEATLGPAVPQASAQFGAAVSVDGGRVLVGAPYEKENGASCGAAYVFVKPDGGAWAQEARLSGASRPGEPYFGISVWLDGDLAVVGAPGDDTGAPDAGSIAFASRSGGSWSAPTFLSPAAPSEGLRFGTTVALDEERLLVSGRNQPATPATTTVFVADAGGWVPQPVPIGGSAAAIRGGLAVVGSDYADEGPINSGSARIIRFERDCNGNGTSDRCDIASGASLDLNLDGIPDECQAHPGDVNGDGSVDGADLGLMIASWGVCAAPCPADQNGDGLVDGADIGVLVANWAP